MLLLYKQKDIVCQSFNDFTTSSYISPMHWYLVPLLAVKLFAIQTNNKGKNEEIKSLSLSLSLSLKRVILVLTINCFTARGLIKNHKETAIEEIMNSNLID